MAPFKLPETCRVTQSAHRATQPAHHVTQPTHRAIQPTHHATQSARRVTQTRISCEINARDAGCRGTAEDELPVDGLQLNRIERAVAASLLQ